MIHCRSTHAYMHVGFGLLCLRAYSSHWTSGGGYVLCLLLDRARPAAWCMRDLAVCIGSSFL